MPSRIIAPARMEWKDLVAAVKEANPELTLKEVLVIASKLRKSNANHQTRNLKQHRSSYKPIERRAPRMRQTEYLSKYLPKSMKTLPKGKKTSGLNSRKIASMKKNALVNQINDYLIKNASAKVSNKGPALVTPINTFPVYTPAQEAQFAYEYRKKLEKSRYPDNPYDERYEMLLTDYGKNKIAQQYTKKVDRKVIDLIDDEIIKLDKENKKLEQTKKNIYGKIYKAIKTNKRTKDMNVDRAEETLNRLENEIEKNEDLIRIGLAKIDELEGRELEEYTQSSANQLIPEREYVTERNELRRQANENNARVVQDYDDELERKYEDSITDDNRSIRETEEEEYERKRNRVQDLLGIDR